MRVSVLACALLVLTSCASMVKLEVYEFPVPSFYGKITPLEPGETISMRYRGLDKTPFEAHMVTDFTAMGDRYLYDVKIDGIVAVTQGNTAVHTGVTINSMKGLVNGKLANHAEMKLAWVSEYDLSGRHVRDLTSGLTNYRTIKGDGFRIEPINDNGVVFPNLQQNVGQGDILARYRSAPAFNQMDSKSSAECRLLGRVKVSGIPGVICQISGVMESHNQHGSIQGYVVFDEVKGTMLQAAYTVKGPGQKIPDSLYSQKITFQRKT